MIFKKMGCETVVKQYDVIIAGARVAGSALAIKLSRSGYSVLLLDKASFPSDTLSTHNFLSHSMPLLRDLGVLEALLETGTPTYSRAVIRFEDAVIDGEFPEVGGYKQCLCIRRFQLDDILFRHAASQPNVTAIEGFRVTDVLRHNGTVIGVEGVKLGMGKQRFGAKLVVGADGRNSAVRDMAGSRQLMAVPTDFASFVGYYEGYKQDGDLHTELYKMGDKLGIVFPTGGNLYVVGVMFPLKDDYWLERFRKSPGEAMGNIIQAGLPGTPVAAALPGASLVGQVKGLLGYDNDWHQGMGGGWALVGDALTFKDPAVGQGMPDAMYSANMLTDVLNRYAGRWEDNWPAMAELYQRQAEDMMMSRFQMACKFTKNVPFTPQERYVNGLIASSPAASGAFLGIYNRAVEPEQFQAVVASLLQGQGVGV